MPESLASVADKKPTLDGPAWDVLSRLFEEARSQGPAERAAWLARAAAGRPDLVAEVEAMLESEASQVLLELEGRLAERAGAADAEPESLPAGTRVGCYSLIREIGRGGMGEVYLAERADGRFEQQVAVKIVRGGIVGAQALRRFERERQIQASLNHASVVPLLDAGIAPDGRPYLVLQYVEGRPITEDADARRLSVADRLRCFALVCRAVQYAHSRLVVHRDIKPSNIVVTPDGAIRLLDFGIAKFLSDDPLTAEPGLTRGALAPMTPERAAPEQLRGEPVTTATDVWGLGVLLFELLAGRLPFGATGSSSVTTHRAITDREPRLVHALPDGEATLALAESRATSASRLRRELGGDIETVVAKALRVEPERRYASAAELADDVDCVLEGRPISARPDSLGYRTRRFVGRHRAEVTLAITAVIAAAAFVVSTAVQSIRVARERDRAEAEERRAGAVVDLLVGLFGATAPTEGASVGSVSVDELLKNGERRIDGLSSQPAVQARMYRTLGRIRRERSEFATARSLLDRALQAHARVGAGEVDPERLEAVFERARVLESLKVGAEAIQELREAVSALEEAGEAARPLLGEGLRLLGDVMPRGPENEAILRRSLSLRRAMQPVDPVALAGSLDALGAHRVAGGANDEARVLWQEALALLERARGPDHIQTLAVLSNLALTMQPREQAALQRRLIQSHERLLGPKSAVLANDWNNLGVTLVRARDYAGAEAALRKSLALRSEVQGELHQHTISTLRNVARTLELQGRAVEALVVFDEVERRLLRASVPPERLAHFRIQRAQVLLRLGRAGDAESLARQALSALRRARPPQEADVAGASLVLGRIALTRQDVTGAFVSLRDSVSIRERSYDPDDPRTAEARAELGRALLASGDAAGAPLLRAALPILRGWGQLHPDDLRAAESALAALR